MWRNFKKAYEKVRTLSKQRILHKIILKTRQRYFHIQSAAFNVTQFESRITHLLYTEINTTEHG
jgi:hypothetical protein